MLRRLCPRRLGVTPQPEPPGLAAAQARGQPGSLRLRPARRQQHAGPLEERVAMQEPLAVKVKLQSVGLKPQPVEVEPGPAGVEPQPAR